jgi:hypothetical protein
MVLYLSDCKMRFFYFINQQRKIGEKNNFLEKKYTF